MAGWRGARLRGVDGTKPFVLLVVAQRWPVAHMASCPSVPSTCLDLIYFTQHVRPPTARYMDYCTHTHAKSPFCRSIAPPKSLVLPQIPPQARQLAEQQHTSPDSQQTLNPPLSLVSTARPRRSLFCPSDRQISHCRPDHRRSQSSTLLLDSPRRLPPQFANIKYIAQTRLVSTATHTPCLDPSKTQPRCRTTGDVEQVSSTSHDDIQGQGTARDWDKALRHNIQYIERGTTPKSRRPPPIAPTIQSGRLLIAEYGLCHCVPEAQTQHSPFIVLRRPHPDCLGKP